MTSDERADLYPHPFRSSDGDESSGTLQGPGVAALVAYDSVQPCSRCENAYPTGLLTRIFPSGLLCASCVEWVREQVSL